MPEVTIEESLYFPIWMGEELVQLAGRLKTTVGTLVWAAWEAAKGQLYQMTALLDDIPPEGSMPPVAKVRPAPPTKMPPNFSLPQIAPLLSIPTETKDKQMVKVVVPVRVLREVRSFSIGADQSLSWTLQQAIRLVRPRLHAATVR
jgi:hypothetical protein